MARPDLLTFDLVVATVDRSRELERLFASLADQTHTAFRVILADQNEDDRLSSHVSESGLDVLHIRSERGLSRARNAALLHVHADVVAFPDDDCTYPGDLLEDVARRLAGNQDLQGLTGRAVDADGRSSPSWKLDRALLTRDNLWNRANSFTTFLRRSVVTRVGQFDQRLGLGSDEPWSSAEEIDYLIRAIAVGARIEYLPELTVVHDAKPRSREDLRLRGYRDGASVGYLLRKHRYPRRMVARMLVRPIGGMLVSLARLDPARARFNLATAQGRVAGLRAREIDVGRATTGLSGS